MSTNTNTNTDANTNESEFYDSHDAGVGWATPREYWEPLADALGGFDLDPASGAEATPIADDRYTVADNGLEQPWYGDVWVNPPYGRSENPAWASKASSEARREAVDTLTALVPNSTGARWFRDNYAAAEYITHIDGRISFNDAGDDDADAGTATFYNVLVTWGDVPEPYLDACSQLGTVYERR